MGQVIDLEEYRRTHGPAVRLWIAQVRCLDAAYRLWICSAAHVLRAVSPSFFPPSQAE
jgi:hypothetical protein